MIKLNSLQQKCLSFFDVVSGSQYTITIARLLHIERAAAKNICNQLLKLGFLKHKDDLSYSITDAGKMLLQSSAVAAFNHDATDAEVEHLERLIIKALEGEGDKIKYPQRTCVHVARLLGMQDHKKTLALFMKDMVNQGKIRFFTNNSTFSLNKRTEEASTEQLSDVEIEAAAHAENQVVVTDVAADRLDQYSVDVVVQDIPVNCADVLPPELEISLKTLQEKITYPPKIVVQQLDLKVQVLDRLSALMDDSIAVVLKQISRDLTDISNIGVTP